MDENVQLCAFFEGCHGAFEIRWRGVCGNDTIGTVLQGDAAVAVRCLIFFKFSRDNLCLFAGDRFIGVLKEKEEYAEADADQCGKQDRGRTIQYAPPFLCCIRCGVIPSHNTPPPNISR